MTSQTGLQYASVEEHPGSRVNRSVQVFAADSIVWYWHWRLSGLLLNPKYSAWSRTGDSRPTCSL